jgi:hypothetical protein
MGAVYLARQERPHRQVAVKVLHPRFMADPAAWRVFLARFQREADATAALEHKNIIPIHEFGEQDGIVYLVMPYLPDGSLADLLAREGPQRLDHAIGYLTQAAAALDYAHAHGILHRDVKPSNLLLHHDGRLVLADFGLARPLRPTADPGVSTAATMGLTTEAPDATLTQNGVAMGTPQYMAPEQILGEPLSAATDIYALGILAYALLAGQPPFDGGPTSEILRRQLGEPPASLRMRRPDAPPQVERVIAWALAKRPADRPPSAGAFAQALEDVAGGWGGAGTGTGTVGSHSVALMTSPAYPPAPHTQQAHNAPTLYDAGVAPYPVAYAPGGAPAWPGMQMRPAASAPQRQHPIRIACLSVLATLLVTCVALGGLSAYHSLSQGPGASASQTPTAPVRTPTPTPIPPTPTPTPVVNWLSVSPTHIALGCGGTLPKSFKLELRNRGPRETWWRASVSPSGSLSVDPSFSALPSGNSVTITLTNTTTAIFGIFGSGRRGTITFKPTSAGAGAAAVVMFTTRAC